MSKYNKKASDFPVIQMFDIHEFKFECDRGYYDAKHEQECYFGMVKDNDLLFAYSTANSTTIKSPPLDATHVVELAKENINPKKISIFKMIAMLFGYAPITNLKILDNEPI